MSRWLLPAVACGVLALAAPTPGWADFDDGLAAYERGDHAAALREFSALAEQGHPKAQHIPGFRYSRSDGVPRDYLFARMRLAVAISQLPHDKMYDVLVAARDPPVRDMTPAQSAEAERLAREWTPEKQEADPRAVQSDQHQTPGPNTGAGTIGNGEPGRNRWRIFFEKL